MINFRFHLVSLIAVFLALGLGILVGSSVVDRAIVDNLRNEIHRVRDDSSQANANLRQRDADASRLDNFINSSAAYTVDLRLSGVSVVLLAERGIDGNVAKNTLKMVLAAGAESPGIIWLTAKWQLNSPDDLQKLQDVTGASGNNASRARRRAATSRASAF